MVSLRVTRPRLHSQSWPTRTRASSSTYSPGGTGTVTAGPVSKRASGPDMAGRPLGTRRVPQRRGSTTVISGWCPSVTGVPGRKSASIGPGRAGRGGRRQVAGAVDTSSNASAVLASGPGAAAHTDTLRSVLP